MTFWGRVERLVTALTSDSAAGDDPEARAALLELEAFLAADEPSAVGRRSSAGSRPAADPPIAVQQALYDLEVPAGVGEEELRRAYRALLRRYHPDRYPSGTAGQETASEVTRRITLAYRTVREYYFA